MADKRVVRLSPIPTRQRSQQSAQKSRTPIMAERDQRNASANRYALGALGCGLLTAAAAIVAMPSAYLLVSNPVVRAVVYTVPVLVPAFGAAGFAVRAMQEGRAAQALVHAKTDDNDEIV